MRREAQRGARWIRRPLIQLQINIHSNSPACNQVLCLPDAGQLLIVAQPNDGLKFHLHMTKEIKQSLGRIG